MVFRENSYYINGILHSDERIVNELYQKLFPISAAYITKNGGSYEDAEDIFQHVIMQIATRIKALTFNTEAPLDAYILKACKNNWMKAAKKRSKHRVTSWTEMDVEVKEEIANNVVDQERYDLFREKLTQLTDNCKSVLQLHFDGNSGKQIMASLNYASELTVRQRIFKCKQKLIKLVQQDSRFMELY